LVPMPNCPSLPLPHVYTSPRNEMVELRVAGLDYSDN